MGTREALGRHGEEVAAEYLRGVGMVVLERNWRCRLGEIDIVAVEGDCLAVCEVKTRRVLLAGGPIEAVTPVKLTRLRRLTAIWLAGQQRRFAQVRIDVVGVFVSTAGRSTVRHLKGVS